MAENALINFLLRKKKEQLPEGQYRTETGGLRGPMPPAPVDMSNISIDPVTGEMYIMGGGYQPQQPPQAMQAGMAPPQQQGPQLTGDPDLDRELIRRWRMQQATPNYGGQ